MNDDVIRKMYGGAAPSTPAAAPVTQRDASAALYQKPAAPTAPASRPSDPASLFYGGDPVKAFATVFRKYEASLFDVGLTAADLAREQQVFATTVRELGVRHDTASRFYSLYAEERIRLARHPRTPEDLVSESVSRESETRQALREKFGEAEADLWLARVDAFVSAQPV